MMIFTSYLYKASKWLLYWPYLILFFIVICIIFYLLWNYKHTKYKSQRFAPRNWSIDAGSYKNKIEHMIWTNRLLSWLFSTSSIKLPVAVETWIHDLNMNIAMRSKKFSFLIYGLKDGSVLPSLTDIRSMKSIGKDIHADILLTSVEFGFLIAVQESQDTVGTVTSANYIATVIQFKCWCSAVLTRLDGNVGLIIKPIEKRPTCQFKIKALSKNITTSTKVEVVAQILRDALVETTFYANLTILSSNLSVVHDAASEAEDSSNEEDVIKNKKVSSIQKNVNAELGGKLENDSRTQEHLSKKFPLDDIKPKSFKTEDILGGKSSPKLVHPGGDSQSAVVNELRNRMAARGIKTASSANPHPIQHFTAHQYTNQIKDFQTDNQHKVKGNPLHLPHTNHLSPPGGPHPHGRCLVIEDVVLKPSEPRQFFPIHCTFQLDHPHQHRTRYLYPNSSSGTINFDIGYRSSVLTITLRNSPSSIEPIHCSGSVVVDPVNIKTSTRLSIPMKNGGHIGYLCMKVSIAAKQTPDNFTEMENLSITNFNNPQGGEVVKKGNSQLPMRRTSPSHDGSPPRRRSRSPFKKAASHVPDVPTTTHDIRRSSSAVLLPPPSVHPQHHRIVDVGSTSGGFRSHQRVLPTEGAVNDAIHRKRPEENGATPTRSSHAKGGLSDVLLCRTHLHSTMKHLDFPLPPCGTPVPVTGSPNRQSPERNRRGLTSSQGNPRHRSPITHSMKPRSLHGSPTRCPNKVKQNEPIPPPGILTQKAGSLKRYKSHYPSTPELLLATPNVSPSPPNRCLAPEKPKPSSPPVAPSSPIKPSAVSKFLGRLGKNRSPRSKLVRNPGTLTPSPLVDDRVKTDRISSLKHERKKKFL